LGLFLDNNLPDVRILGITYKGRQVAPCDIVDIDEGTDPVKVRVRAWDAEGDMHSYALNAWYGDGRQFDPPIGFAGYPGGNWQGDTDHEFTASIAPKFPPITCAYQFRLSANPRTTNGYGYVGYVEATSHVTFRRVGAPAPMASREASHLPSGFTADGRFEPGTTPGKVGG
jgi:hypothetical protein